MSIEKQTSASYAIHREMPNGARVSDWLGTAETAARVAASHLRDVRAGNTYAVSALDVAESQLVQALEELRAVRSEVER
jgi:hypothetical protein